VVSVTKIVLIVTAQHSIVSPYLSYYCRNDRECFNLFVTFPASNLCGPNYSYCPEDLLFGGLVDFLSCQTCCIFALLHLTHIRTYVRAHVWLCVCVRARAHVCICMYELI